MTQFEDLEKQVNDILGNDDMNNSKNSTIIILVASIVLSFIITYLIARRLNKILFLIILWPVHIRLGKLRLKAMEVHGDQWYM